MDNHAMCFHKIVYDGLHRLLLNKMEDNDVDSFELSSVIYDIQERVNEFHENHKLHITQVSLDDLIESVFLKTVQYHCHWLQAMFRRFI